MSISNCRVCGERFDDNGWRVTCSSACAAAIDTRNKYRIRAYRSTKRATKLINCRVCGSLFESDGWRVTCSSDCVAAHYERRQETVKAREQEGRLVNCRICQVEFNNEGYRVTCSTVCSDENKYRARRARQSRREARKRKELSLKKRALRHCRNCGVFIGDGPRYKLCEDCHSKIYPVARPRKCYKCGNVITNKRLKYCIDCVPVKVRQPRVIMTEEQLRENKSIHYYERYRELSITRRRQARIETRAAVEVAVQLGIATDDVKYPVTPEGGNNKSRKRPIVSQLNKELWQYMVDANLPLTTSEMTELFAMVKYKERNKRTKEQNERRRERERKRGIIRDAFRDEGLLDSLKGDRKNG